MKDAVIVAAVRSPMGKAGKGLLANMRIDDLGALILKAALARVPQIKPEEIEDLLLGCAMPEGEQGMNVARNIGLLAGLPNEKFFREGMPQAYISMGITAENVAAKYKVSREDQDRFAFASHQKATKAQETGAFREELVPVEVVLADGKKSLRRVGHKKPHGL